MPFARRPALLAIVPALLVLTAPARAAEQYALLVGCTKYDNAAIRELWGPANDVQAWAKLLTEQFGFAPANVMQLVGVPAAPEKKPTYANVAKGFESLIDRAKPGDRIFILLSGHGTQIPIPVGQDPLDPRHFKPDGLDEAFLPADVKIDEGQLENHLIDHKIGEWLDRMRAKGADVLIVFDCCHAGTMARDQEDVERYRAVLPQTLGISDKAIEDAVKRAKDAVAKTRQKAEKEGRPFNLESASAKIRPAKDPKGAGSLVAFYAAQSFEKAPEFALPEGAPPAREYFYGFLSWTLMELLGQRQTSLTYRELAQVMVARYRAVRGTRGPLPFAEGDLDREVLGFNVWPNRGQIVLHNENNQPLKVSAGQLAGVTPESILAVYPPTLDPKKRDPRTIIGHVRVKSATIYNATVVPCEFDKKPAVAESELDNLARCEVVVRDYGDVRVKLFVGDNATLKKAFDKIDKQVLEMMKVVKSEVTADWVLKPVDPKAAAEFGLKLPGEAILLVRGEGYKSDTPEARAEAKAYADHLARLGKPPSRRAFGAYPIDNLDRLVEGLERDLPKVFKWQNVLKVAGGVATNKGGDALKVKVEVRRYKDGDDMEGELLRSGSIVPRTAILGFRVDNTQGKHNLWVVALWLDAELQIQVYDQVIAVAAYKSADFDPAGIKLPLGAFGTESLVVLAFPQSVQRDKPDFDFLTQSPLRVPETMNREARLRSAGESPFARLMARSTLSGGHRGGEPIVNTTPAVMVHSWFVAP